MESTPSQGPFAKLSEKKGQDVASSKADLRQRLIEWRSALPPQEVQARSGRIMARLRGVDRLAAASEVALYMAVRGEVDCSSLLPELWARSARVLLPRCKAEPGVMGLHCVNCLDEIKPGRYRIPEPDPDRCPELKAFAPDVILIPGVAFDRRGRRLGFGGGYYDRLLAQPTMRNTLVIGLTYQATLLDELPVEPWDRPVHVVCAEEELLWIP